MVKIKTEDEDDIPIEYVRPNEIPLESPEKRTTSVIIPKSDSAFEEVLSCLDITVCEPTIIERYDNSLSQLEPPTNDRSCIICNSFPSDYQSKELPNDVCKKCSSNYLPRVALIKLRACRVCQRVDGKTPFNGQNEESIACGACNVESKTDNLELQGHIDGSQNIKRHTCNQCEYATAFLGNLIRHYRKHNGVKNLQSFECIDCHKKFAEKRYLLEHRHLLESQRKKFECRECDARFYMKKSLLDHQAKHNVKLEDVRHVCPKCSKEFAKIGGLKLHMTIHRKYTFDCHFCTRHFSSAAKLEVHENAKHKIAKFGRRKFECYVCRMPMKNLWKLQFHLRKHSGERPFRCETCSKGFMLKSILVKHRESHWNEADKLKRKKFKCHLCGYQTARRQLLDVHLERHITGPFSCKVCSKEFQTEGRLKYHQRVHSGIYRNKYICYICNYVGGDITSVRKHLLTHSNEKPFQCEICDKHFKYRQTLKGHQKTHMDKIELDKLKKWKCNLCEYATRNIHNLNRHILTHTGGGEKKFPCTKCSLKFPDKTQLKSHMETHLDDSQRIKKFKCTDCQYATSSSGNLKRHIASKHSDTKPFACDKCPQTYSDSTKLKNHLRAHIETPHFCSECPRKFAQKSELTKHMAGHKPKRFQCKFCPKKFTMKFDMNRHIKSLHSEPSSPALPCTKCGKKFRDQIRLNRHYQRHFNAPKYRFYECYICQYSANVFYKLKRHMLQHQD